jgi:hypothetical protein
MADEDRLIIEHVNPERWESGERFGFPADGPRGRGCVVVRGRDFVHEFDGS